MAINLEIEEAIKKLDSSRTFTDAYPSPPYETVYEAAIRYGKIAYYAYTNFPDGWDKLTKEQQHAWIECAKQVERAVLKDQE